MAHVKFALQQRGPTLEPSAGKLAALREGLHIRESGKPATSLHGSTKVRADAPT